MSAPSSPLRVLHVVSPQPPGETGGVDLHVADLAAAQVAGHAARPLVVELGAKGYAATLVARGVEAVTIADPYRGDVLRRVAASARRHGADVVHSHGYDADVISAGAWLLCRRRPALVATVHGLVWHPSRNAAKTLANLAVLAACADAVIATSTDRARKLARWLRTPATMIANGVDVGATTSRCRKDRAGPILAYVGRLSPEKRVDLFLDVCALVAGTFPSLRGHIVGTGPEHQGLRRHADELGIGDRVDFVGLVADVPAALAEVDTLLLLSDTEGTPRVLIEAMAAGVPIVATRVGGIPDLLHDGRDAVLVPRGDTCAAAAAVERLLTEPDLTARLVASARERYQTNLTMTRMSSRVLDVYHRAAAVASSRRAASSLVAKITVSAP